MIPIIAYRWNWCPEGLNREAGATPARSRHCNGEHGYRDATEMKVLGRRSNVRSRSQETCQFSNHRYDLRSMGMEISSFCVAFFLRRAFPLQEKPVFYLPNLY